MTGNEERNSFRSTFLPTFVFLIALGGVMGYGLIWFESGPDLDPIGLLVAEAVALFASVYYTHKLVSKFLVYITPDGIKTYDVYGAYYFAEWSSVFSVSCLNLVVLRFFVLRTRTGSRALLVPMNLVEGARFRYRVLEWAGRAHPLTQALLKNH